MYDAHVKSNRGKEKYKNASKEKNVPRRNVLYLPLFFFPLSSSQQEPPATAATHIIHVHAPVPLSLCLSMCGFPTPLYLLLFSPHFFYLLTDIKY